MDEKVDFRTYGIGSIVYDRAYIVDDLPLGEEFPEPGQKRELSDVDFAIFACNFFPNRIDPDYEQTGGPVPSALRVHARWGNNTPTQFGVIGDDAIGEQARKDIESRSIHARLVTSHNDSSPQSVIWIDDYDGSRSILYTRGSAPKLDVDEIERLERLNPFVSGKSLLHIDATEPLASKWASELIHIRQGFVYLDTGDFKTYNDGTDLCSLLGSADIIQTPLRCAREIAKRIPRNSNTPVGELSKVELADAIREFSHSHIVVVTDGINGIGYSAHGVSHQSEGEIPAYVGRIEGCGDLSIDETGAGDIFAGSFSFALMKGDSLQDALYVAIATAASSTRFHGNDHFVEYDIARSHIGRSLD